MNLTIDFRAHFDGKVIAPEQAVNLPKHQSFVVDIETWTDAEPAAEAAAPQSALQWLAQNALEDELPGDLSAQQDHYLPHA